MDNDTSTFSSLLPIELETLTSLLRSLSSQILTARTAAKDPSEFGAQHLLTTSAPLFAALHALNRNTLGFNKECKGRTQAARLEMDSAHLRLQVSLDGGGTLLASIKILARVLSQVSSKRI